MEQVHDASMGCCFFNLIPERDGRLLLFGFPGEVQDGGKTIPEGFLKGLVPLFLGQASLE